VNTLIRTTEFDDWMRALRDPQGEARILLRLRSASKGNFGDCKSVGDGISEMRIHAGPGYRIYFTRRGEVVYLLLLGGDKSTQARDIKQAKAILKTLPKE
jgi:putative addiction module killer protein